MLQAGDVLGSYHLIARIGVGGMGEVWKAEDTRLGRMVAIKILPAAIASQPEALARMRREARTAAQLNHPNIATIHSFEQDGGRMFIVMELVDGEPLTARIARGPMPEGEISRIGRGVADALAEAHAKGVVHRDIKPDNILVTDSRVKVLDFGIAKRVGLEMTASETPTAFITQEGMILGTVHYMSPEQALGKQVDARTDIFSLGVVLYQMATGKQPFGGETITETITQIIRDEPAEPRRVNPSISPGLNAIIRRCLRKNRDERFPGAAELAGALADGPTRPYTAPRVATRVTAPAAVTVKQPAASRRSPALWIAVAALILIAGIAAVYSRQHRLSGAPVSSPAPVVPSTTTMEVTPPTVAVQPAPTVPITTQSGAPADSTGDDRRGAGRSTEVQPKLVQPKPVQRRPVQPTPVQPTPAPPTPVPPTPVPPTPTEQLNRGLKALFNRNLGVAEQHLRAALEHPGELDPHQRQLVHLALAIARGNRERAQQIAREMHQANPNDPELQRILRTFPIKPMREGEGGRRRWKPRSE